MYKYLTLTAIALLFVFSGGDAEAACTSQVKTDGPNDEWVLYTGSCTEDNEVLIQAVVEDYDACYVVSTTGAVDVLVSLDGSTYTTAALSLIDNGATDTDPVVVTVALRAYGFPVMFRRLRIMENGATDAAAHLFCKNYD